MKKRKRQKPTFIFLGMTTGQLAKQLKQLDHAESAGRPAPSARRCFLCKRLDGEESVVIKQGEKRIRPGKLEVNPVEIPLGSSGTLVYNLCFECFCLLSRFPRRVEKKKQ